MFLAGLPTPEPQVADDALEEEFRHLAAFRRVVNEALEAKRVAKEIGKATEADVVLRVPRQPPVLREVAQKYEAQLADLFGGLSATGFGRIWSSVNAAIFVYASASNNGSKQRASIQLTDASVTQLSSWLADTTDLPADSCPACREARRSGVVRAGRRRRRVPASYS